MARGWESKSVEAQIEEGERSSEPERSRKSNLSLEAQQQLESLRLARSRTEDQLSRAVHPAHRQTLMKALQSIEKQVEVIQLNAANSSEQQLP
ncbi:MAG TPA: hypothetical protein VJT50_13410 [Pyrinomonadaceae bacterium]|nr:hypothetical protein [Pyrinomonadaceae bacterium]